MGARALLQGQVGEGDYRLLLLPNVGLYIKAAVGECFPWNVFQPKSWNVAASEKGIKSSLIKNPKLLYILGVQGGRFSISRKEQMNNEQQEERSSDAVSI